MKLNRNSKIFINYFLGPALFIWLSWSIYQQVRRQPDLSTAWEAIKNSFSTTLAWNVVAVMLLMVLNWSIEAVKWKIAVKPVQEVSFFKAFRAILSGVSFSVSMPNRIGEYFGRVLYMDEGNKLKTISITIVASISQLIITLFMGGLGILILQKPIENSGLISPIWMQVIIFGVWGVLIGILFFYFRLSWLTRLIEKLPGITRFVYLIRALEEFHTTMLLKLILLSLARFIVFILQYYLLFRLFSVDVNWMQCYWAVSISFLVMACIPTIAIAELVQRGKVLTTIMTIYTSNQLGVGFTTAGIWLINLIFPAIIGSLLIFSIKKIYREKKE
jgi:hypothetical protein